MSSASTGLSQFTRLRWPLLLAAGILLLGAAALRWSSPTPRAVRQEGSSWVEDRGEYAGTDACRPCHSQIVRDQLASNHARTIRDLSREAPLARFDTDEEIVDPFTGARYGARIAGKRQEIRVSLGGLEAKQRLDYEFGSGRYAYGYLGKIDDNSWVDARLNYYEQIHGWGFTSGQDKPTATLRSQPLGRPQTATDALRCFACHSTVVRVDGLGKSAADGSGLRVRPEHSSLGVSCEACHGGRAGHVRERREGKPLTQPVKLSADDLNQVCGRCHGLSNVDPAHPVIARFQPWGLRQSRCFQESQGRLSCVTCHDPHRNTRPETAFYEAKCLGCHSGSNTSGPNTLVAGKVCPVNSRSGCVRCHMPRDDKSMLHVSLTDHRIRIVSPRAAALRAAH